MRRLAAVLIGVVLTGTGEAKPAACKCPGCECTECKCRENSDCGCSGCIVTDYTEAKARAMKERRPLIVWVGCEARPHYHPEAIHCAVARFPEVGRGVVVSRPRETYLEWLATLPANTVPDAIWQALNGAASVRATVPPTVPQSAPAPLFRPLTVPQDCAGGT